MLIRKTMDHKHDLGFRISTAEFVVITSFISNEEAKQKYTIIKEKFEEQTGVELIMKVIDSNDETTISEKTALTDIS